MANFYECSDGSKVTQATIDSRRSKAYREFYSGNPHPICEGCGRRAEGSSHIISQQRCKHLHRTEWIWQSWNWFPACHRCNSRWESNDASLMNYKRCMEVLEQYDLEGYNKRL